MRKKALLLFIGLAILIGGCHNLAGNISPAETYVSSYEIVGAVYPLAKVYLGRLEENGSLTGDKLTSFKAKYGSAKTVLVQGGNLINTYIDNPSPVVATNYPALLRQAMIMLADLTGPYVTKKGIAYNPFKDMSLKDLLERGKQIKEDRKKMRAGEKISVDEIVLSLNLAMAIVDKLVAYYAGPETLTAEQKAAYHTRVNFVIQTIPDWN